ncbi:hypothetical protein BVI2075_230193 [Burkholderia vietnamiensis]|nr:hypothetical protein BVI2075_230193 [Burkholderia vietnamiensis]CAG9234087.1 hypothetical protein BVI1335_940014 [Burkholderia vietnamiensis]
MRRHRAMAADPENETARMLRARGQFPAAPPKAIRLAKQTLGQKIRPKWKRPYKHCL